MQHNFWLFSKDTCHCSCVNGYLYTVYTWEQHANVSSYCNAYMSMLVSMYMYLYTVYTWEQHAIVSSYCDAYTSMLVSMYMYLYTVYT